MTSLDFGAVAVSPYGATDAATTTRYVTLTNRGNAPVILTSQSIAGWNTRSFAIIAGVGYEVRVMPGEARSFSLRFRPFVAGPQSASLIIQHTGPGGVVIVPLGGVGLDPNAAPADPPAANPPADPPAADPPGDAPTIEPPAALPAESPVMDAPAVVPADPPADPPAAAPVADPPPAGPAEAGLRATDPPADAPLPAAGELHDEEGQ